MYKSLDSLSKIVLDHRTALDYIPAEQGVCMTSNSSCTYTSAPMETSITKVRQQATWLQQTLDHHSPLFEGTGDWLVSLLSWVPQGVRSLLGAT